MKYKFATILMISWVLCLSGTVFSQTRLGCGYPTTFDNRGIYYMSCFNRTGGETDDTGRIQAAVNYIAAGKLIFDQNQYQGSGYTTYEVSNSITLHSFLILEGTGNAATYVPASSAIKLTASGTATALKSIFRINEAANDIAIRDLGLFAATGQTYTAGILAQNPTQVNTPSFDLELRNLKFFGFNTGIKIDALDALKEWQYDNIQLEHSVFEGCATGVHINSFNSGWQINSIEFFSPSGSVGIYIERGTYSTIDSVIGNLTGSSSANALIKIKEMAAAMTIRNCVSEGFTNDLVVDALANTAPLTLTGNTFQGQVDLKNTDVISTGNMFGTTTRDQNNNITYRAPQPIARGTSRVTSINDKFCKEFETNCTTGGYQTLDAAYLQFNSDLNKTLFSRPTTIFSSNPAADLTTPLLNLTRVASEYNRPLLRLGNAENHYTLSRNEVGFLKFEGSQPPAPGTSPPVLYRGYSFDAPVQLPEYTVGNLPYPLRNGSIAFCPTCQAGTSPCATGSGGGALAIVINGSWVCK